MDTLKEMREALQDDYSLSENASFLTPAKIDRALNRAYRKSGGIFDWVQLEDAKKTVTEANSNYLDAPTTWKPNSIWKLTIDGNPYGELPAYDPMHYHDFLAWLDDPNNATSTLKKWATQWLRYFFTPTPTVAGLEVCIWGQKNVEKMTEDSSTTIFSGNMPECNEALILEADAILSRKSNDLDTGGFVSEEAKQIFAVTNARVMKRLKGLRRDQPFLNVPDYYNGGNGFTTAKLPPTGLF